jgi:predicted PurR-regulated permease PerM
MRGYMLSGTLGALEFLGQVAVVFFIALFLLSSGNTFRRKMVKLAGPRFSQKKVTIETLDEIAEQIQRYLLVQLGVSVLVGLATWAAFFAIGMDQSAVWGAVAGVTNLIPYLGAVLVSAGSAIVAAVQFGTFEMALLVGGSSFAIHTLIGNILAPWCMGRAGRMSPFAVFVAVLLFGWLWGVWGLLLGVPILMVVKSVCDRVEDLKPIGELLGA